MSPRHLERLFRAAGAPAPKRMIGWLVLLYVEWGAAETGRRPGTIARSVGLAPADVAGLRERLLPDDFPAARAPNDPFVRATALLYAFGRELGIPRNRLGQAVQRYGAA